MKAIIRLKFNLFLLSAALIPLTVSDKRLVLNLGEYRNETYIYPLILLILLTFFTWLFRLKIAVPSKSVIYQFLFILVLIFVFCSLFSIGDILQNDFKNITGIKRFFRQIFSLIFSVIVVPMVLYDLFGKLEINYVMQKLERVLFIVLTIVFIIAMVEISSVIFGQKWANNLILWFNDINPFLYIRQDFTNYRISSISHEPPFLGMYLVFVTPWVLRRLYLNPKALKGLGLLIMVLVLILASKSRAAQLFCFVQIILFTSLVVVKNYKTIKNFIKFGFITFLILPFLLLTQGKEISGFVEERIDSFRIVENIEYNNSNKTRLGTIIAGFIVFTENPVFGVGYGQQAYYITENYPQWAINNNWEIKRYLESDDPNFPPGFNMYVRLLTETGVVGFLSFSLFVFFVIYSCLKRYLIYKDIEYLLFLTIFFGLAMNWIQIDTPRIFSFWITLVLFLTYDRNRESRITRINNPNSSL